jgi:hypothetical protein
VAPDGTACHWQHAGDPGGEPRLVRAKGTSAAGCGADGQPPNWQGAPDAVDEAGLQPVRLARRGVSRGLPRWARPAPTRMPRLAAGSTAWRNSSYSLVDSTRLANSMTSWDERPSGTDTASRPRPLTRTTAGGPDERMIRMSCSCAWKVLSRTKPQPIAIPPRYLKATSQAPGRPGRPPPASTGPER